MRRIILASLCLFLIPMARADLREQYDTRSTACATALQKAIALSGDKQYKEAYTQIQAALQADPQCELATYWLATILMDTGEFEKSMAVFAKIVETNLARDNETASNVAVDSAVNMGLAYGKLGDMPHSLYWLSQSVMLDMKDAHHMQWKAYRNMAISSHTAGDAISATLQALKAKELAPSRVEDAMIEDMASGIKVKPSCINILRFNKEPVEIQHAVRTEPAVMTRDAGAESRLHQAFQVAAMAPVDGRKQIIVFYRDQLTADVLDTATGLVTPMTLNAPAAAADAVADALYVCSASAAALDAYTPAGKLVRSYPLPARGSSLAVCPATRQAFVAAGGTIHIVDLETGKVQATDLIGQVVCLDRDRHLAYASFKPAPRDESGTMIVNGRPVFFSSMGDVFRDQNVIFKGAYKRGGLMALAAIRVEAASNGYTMDLSRNGRWITVTGGGGYRGPGGQQGYGTGVLSADDMAQLEGFYGIDAYSLAATFNPVTEQLALIATGELKIFNLGGSQKEVFLDKGSFSSVAKWSPEGSWLLAGCKEKGVQVYRNKLAPADDQAFLALCKAGEAGRAASRPKAAAVSAAGVQGTPPSRMPGLASFTPATTLAQARERALAGARSSTDAGPALWQDLPIYGKDAALPAKVRKLSGEFKASDAGLVIYQLKGILKQSPDYVPAQCALGMAVFENGDVPEAIRLLLEVVRADAGQSSLTSEALCKLGEAYLKTGRESEALDCLATGLLVDKDHGATIRSVAPLMQKHGIPFRSAAAAGADHAEGGPAVVSGLKLNWPPQRKTEKAIATDVLFCTLAERTAFIKTDAGSGSGVFITDDGYMLTNEHVVKGRSSSIDVTLFRMKDGKVTQVAVSPATIVFADPESDVAVLKVLNLPDNQKSLSLSREAPQTGAKVFAIGSPGLGDRVLEQSLTEGIISSNQRMIDGQPWLQHSAAVNPGNSGGPLVSPYGEIVGLVTLKANMENVGFAIPAARLREILHQQPAP